MTPLPDYQFLPAPLWLITVLHILTLTLHFAAMNFLLGGLIERNAANVIAPVQRMELGAGHLPK